MSVVSLSPGPGTLQEVLAKAVEGTAVLQLCTLGDSFIMEETSKIFKKEKEMKKGTGPVVWMRRKAVYFNLAVFDSQ